MTNHNRWVLYANVSLTLLFVCVLFYSLFYIPLTGRFSNTWTDGFDSYESWQEMQEEGHWYVDGDANVTIDVSSGTLKISQFNMTGDSWIHFNIIENVTEPITDWELEASVKWSSGVGSHVIGILNDGKGSMHNFFLDGWNKEFVLGRGYRAVYISPAIYQPTTGWHRLMLKQFNMTFQIFYDGIMRGEAQSSQSNLPITRVLVGTGYDSASEFDYVKLRYFQVQEIHSNKIQLLSIAIVFPLIAAFLAVGTYLKGERKKSLFAVFICAVFVSVISTKILGENGLRVGADGVTVSVQQVQWLVSTFLALLVFFVTERDNQETG